jgi:uncharacterized protein (DUF2235 family)
VKNIVICSDGTGNTANKGRGTNVFKLFEAVDVTSTRAAAGVAQVAFYDDGVGTEKFTPLKLLGGAAGWGLSRNVKELYTTLARVYEPGDKLFLFGFSRGAFTVRTLASMIYQCGIVDVSHPHLASKAALERAVSRIYKEYRERYQTRFSRLLFGRRSASSLDFARAYRVSHPTQAPDGRIDIEFLGVWDTVDAVGLPFHLADFINEFVYRFKFPDPFLNKQVKKACHALALDEERHSFRPLLWDEKHEQPGRIEQVWFAGVHSNAGGGYPRQGMSLVTLDWMMGRAERHGLRFLPEVRSLYRALQNVDDKLYNPRGGLGVLYRWKPRDIQQLCAQHNVEPAIHSTAFQRISRSTEGYAPGNVPPGCRIVGTEDCVRAASKAAAIQAVLRQSHATRAGKAHLPLLDDLVVPLRTGLASYYLLLASVVYGLVDAAIHLSEAAGHGRSALQCLADMVWQTTTDPLLWAGLISAYGLAYVTDACFSRVCSEFWHKAQRSLKSALADPPGTVHQDPAEHTAPQTRLERPPTLAHTNGRSWAAKRRPQSPRKRVEVLYPSSVRPKSATPLPRALGRKLARAA